MLHLKAHVASVCFRGMLQVFHMDVAKLDRDVTYVAMVVLYVACVYSKCFIYFFRHMFASVFTWMLHMFYLDVAYILQLLFQAFFGCFYKCFRCMLQVFELFGTYVASVSCGCFRSRCVLHLPPRLLLPRLGVSSS